MNEGYFEWLLNKAGVDCGENGYSYLCSILHEVSYRPMLEMDDNRWHDGVQYRWDYAYSVERGSVNEAELAAGYLDDCLGDCTVLELMLSMAEKMRYETADSMYEAGVGKWFEELIGNLGLDIYTNRELTENENAYFEAEGIVQRFVYRKYDWNGEGGLFPLRFAREDQRKVELIIQMNNYLAENYDVL